MTSDFVKLSIKCLCFLRRDEAMKRWSLNRSFVFGRESLPLYLYSYFEKLLLFQMSFLCICRADPQEKRSRTQKMEIDSRPNSRKKMFGQICDFNTKGQVQKGLDPLGKPLFEMCCFHMGIARKGRGCKGLPGWFWALFSHVARGCKGLPGWFEALFSTFACLTEGGGSKANWAMPI